MSWVSIPWSIYCTYLPLLVMFTLNDIYCKVLRVKSVLCHEHWRKIDRFLNSIIPIFYWQRHLLFRIFRIKILAQASSHYFFLLKNFSLLFRYTHGAWERKMYPLHSYIYRAVNQGRRSLMSIWMLVNEGTSTMSFVLRMYL